MKKLISKVIMSIETNLRYPVLRSRLFARSSDLHASLDSLPVGISTGNIIKWHKWSEKRYENVELVEAGEITGWRYRVDSYRSYKTIFDELANFGESREHDTWTCEIQDIIGVPGSKSALNDFNSLDEMVETDSKEMIDELTEEKINKNLEESGILNLQKSSSSGYFVRYLWDGNLFWMTHDGTHHFAAARYIAARISKKVPLTGKLITYAINDRALSSMMQKFDIFLMSDSPGAYSAFHEPMEHFRASYLAHKLPPPCQGYRAIFLPTDEAKSKRVAEVLREAGIVNLGDYLMNLVSHQRKYENN